MIEISRNKQEPTWAMVWNGGCSVQKCERIIVDVFEDGNCVCVDEAGAKDYVENKYYRVVRWDNYEIIKPKSWRPFEDIEEFKKEFVKRDVRIISKTTGIIYLIVKIDDSNIASADWEHSVKYTFDHYTWLDGSPIGVEE